MVYLITKRILSKIKYNYYSSILLGLTFSHLVTAYFWILRSVWLNYSLENHQIYCYPVFKNCYKLVFSDLLYIKVIFFSYLIISVATIFLILIGKKKVFYRLFVFLFFLKATILLSRYNMMGNYHTMHLTMIIITLLDRYSLGKYRFVLCLQYFFAGLLKLNLEWLSGASLTTYSQYLFKGPFQVLSLAYVPVLELVLIWGLMAKSAFLRRLTLLQLFLFHLYSILVVGMYYPLIMTGLLFPLFYIEIASYLKNESLKPSMNFFDFKNVPQTVSSLFIVLLLVWNLTVRLQPFDAAMDGYVRYLSLNMLDARLVCRNTLYEIKSNSDVVSVDIPGLARSLRVRCDPVVFDSFLRRLCERNPEKKFLFLLESKRTTQTKYTEIRNYKDVCKQI